VTASKTTYCFLPRPERASHERKDSEIRNRRERKSFSTDEQKVTICSRKRRKFDGDRKKKDVG
jgi:hypothetical protein